MSEDWMDVNVTLPDDDQRVLGFIPGNKVYLPGKDFQFETREVVVLRFCKDFYAKNEEKRAKHGLHFWSGEGNSNHFRCDWRCARRTTARGSASSSRCGN